MDDYINRQTIIDTIHSAIYPYFCGAEDGDALSEDEKLVLSVNKAVCTAIKALPSAERHGKWIHDGYDFPHGVDWMHCSECGKRDVYCPATRTNFCPNCGARMDGE